MDKHSPSTAQVAMQESELVPYITKSRAPFTLDTLIPRNMAFEVQQSLNRVVKKYGNIDHYVRNHLKYPSTESLWKGLGAEQVDAVALYLAQFERNQGIIIGDQTGIGKGRQAAAIMRHAIVNGYLPVFFTRKPDLFSDMYRDLQAIGFAGIHPFILNTDSFARIRDAKGNVVFSPMTQAEQVESLSTSRTLPTDSPESIDWHRRHNFPLPKTPTITLYDTIDHIPGDYDVVFCTYSQIQAAHVSKRLWLQKLVSRGVEGSKTHKKVVFILDESHMAGGYDAIIGAWMRKVLPGTKACCYLSATFAKYPEVMPLYAQKTAIKETGLPDSDFVYAMQRGGLALQEIVATNLAESGQLIRRQRSNEGIRVEYITLDKEPERSVNRAKVDRITRLMAAIVRFEADFITPHLGAIHARARAEGKQVKSPPSGLGIKQSPYFSRVFNVVDQMLFALKTKQVAEKCIALLEENKKVVIAFKSTMGTFLKDMNLVSGDVITAEQMDFSRTLLKGLDALFYYNFTAIDGSKTREQTPLKELPQIAIDRYHELQQAILSESSGLSISPIDELIQHIQKTKKAKKLGGHNGAYYKVAEVTGRNQRIRITDEGGTIESFRSDTGKAFRQFNEGSYDVLLINQSGSTGSSAHASKDFADQRQRAMIIHQFELDINIEIQKRGRINRTGQVALPEYYYMVSDIPLEKRLMTMLKGKLKALDANTTGSQKTNDDTLKSPDFFNKYGDKAAFEWVNENRGIMDQMGWPTFHKVTGKDGQTSMVRNESREGAIRQVTGRAGLLMVADQDRLYNDLLEKYHHQVEWEKQRGTYDLETEFLPLDAQVKKTFLFMAGNGGATPFGRDTLREETIVNNLKRPYTRDEIDQVLTKILDGRKPAQVQQEWLQEVEQAYPAIMDKRRKERQETIDKLKKEWDSLQKDTSEEERPGDAQKKGQLSALIRDKTAALNLYMSDLEAIRDQIIKHLQYWQPGQVVRIPLPGTNTATLGLFLGAGINKGLKNPYTLSNITLKFAVADHRRLVEFNLTA